MESRAERRNCRVCVCVGSASCNWRRRLVSAGSEPLRDFI
jgi:hypothetical protein